VSAAIKLVGQKAAYRKDQGTPIQASPTKQLGPAHLRPPLRAALRESRDTMSDASTCQGCRENEQAEEAADCLCGACLLRIYTVPPVHNCMHPLQRLLQPHLCSRGEVHTHAKRVIAARNVFYMTNLRWRCGLVSVGEKKDGRQL